MDLGQCIRMSTAEPIPLSLELDFLNTQVAARYVIFSATTVRINLLMISADMYFA